MANNEPQIADYLEQYSSIFNLVAQDIVKHSVAGDTQSSPLLGDLKKLQSLLSGETKVDVNNLFNQQVEYMQKQTELWQNASKALLQGQSEDGVKPSADKKRKDRRFTHVRLGSEPSF